MIFSKSFIMYPFVSIFDGENFTWKFYNECSLIRAFSEMSEPWHRIMKRKNNKSREKFDGSFSKVSFSSYSYCNILYSHYSVCFICTLQFYETASIINGIIVFVTRRLWKLVKILFFLFFTFFILSFSWNLLQKFLYITEYKRT